MEQFLTSISATDLIEALPDAIIISDLNGIICSTNQKVKQVFGYAPTELIGGKVEILLPERFRGMHEKQMAAYFSHPENKKMASHRKVMGMRKDRSEFEIDITLAPLRIQDQLFSISSCRDISDKKEHEKELERENQSLEHVNKELEKYSYTVSHDLKAPLVKIEGLINILTNNVGQQMPEEEISKIYVYIKETAFSMKQLVKGILEEAQNGFTAGEDRLIYLNDILKELKKLISIPENFSIKLASAPSYVKGKRIQLLQVFVNLIDNAVKYNDKEHGEVNIFCRDRGDHYQFMFLDNGPGIPHNKLHRIFDLFEKGNNGTAPFSHGIGLFTVKSIIESRGGKISVWSEPGRGTTFEFTWPKSPVLRTVKM